MEHENKDRSTNATKINDPGRDAPDAMPPDTDVHREAGAKAGTDACAEPPCRMILTGVTTAAILSIIAVLVAGIFHLSSKWLTTCPHDLPINDPAPILWNQMTSARGPTAPLGVPAAVVAQARFKGGNPVSDTGTAATH
jgi:hypothetical protein